jgi:hypothetical protein
MLKNQNVNPESWLAFELNVLRRLKFKSVAFPFTTNSILPLNLKRWNIRVSANDAMLSHLTDAVANIQNNGENLSDDDLNVLFRDIYVPQFQLTNPSLRKWFGESESWWFDNLRTNIDKLESENLRAKALLVGMAVGDYVLSFDESTLNLRQPLSGVFRRLLSSQPISVNSGQPNPCSNKLAFEFLAENYSDLLFLRLPKAHNLGLRDSLGNLAWREEWIRGNCEFWNQLEAHNSNRLGAAINSKSQYLKHLENLLLTAKHIPNWAIAHVDSGFVSTQDIVETVNKLRKIDTIYTKDFSELTGIKAVLITA